MKYVETKVLDYPLPGPPLRQPLLLELAVEPDELVKLEGLIVGGLTEVPVRW